MADATPPQPRGGGALEGTESGAARLGNALRELTHDVEDGPNAVVGDQRAENQHDDDGQLLAVPASGPLYAAAAARLPPSLCRWAQVRAMAVLVRELCGCSHTFAML
ncbi:hypothetical protein GCM10010244_56340 [Streptomyces coeruleorubidus]|nr:hypothetical protein GCM10010244_56340 [Streptomyces bellus]